MDHGGGFRLGTSSFMKVKNGPGEKLGPLRFHFWYFDKKAFVSLDEFLSRFAPFFGIMEGSKFELVGTLLQRNCTTPDSEENKRAFRVPSRRLAEAGAARHRE